MFVVNLEDGSVTMHRGDTGAFWVRAARSTGAEFGENDRMIYTVRAADGTIMLQRYYRLDTEAGNGVCLIQFHNGDTDTWSNGNYETERRYVIGPYWDGDAPDGDVVDALTSDARIVDGDTVRVPADGQSSLILSDVYGEV